MWQGDEYDNSYKKQHFAQYRDDLANNLQSLRTVMSRARDSRFVALAPDAVWEYGSNYAAFSSSAWPLVLEHFAGSATRLSRGEEFGTF